MLGVECLRLIMTSQIVTTESLFKKTYINQFFGDQTVREIISEIYTNKTSSPKKPKTGQAPFNIKIIPAMKLISPNANMSMKKPVLFRLLYGYKDISYNFLFLVNISM